MAASIEVRRALGSDAASIAGIHVTAWRETYAHLVAADALAALDPANRVDRWRDIIAGPEEAVWVAELDGIAVAWATTSALDIATEPRGLEVNGLYALSSAHGSGVGQALLGAAIGNDPAFLWVAADNPRAQSFYARNGFAPDGATREYDLLGSAVSIVRWVR